MLHVKEVEAGADVGYVEPPTLRKPKSGLALFQGVDGWTRDMQGFDVLIDGLGKGPIVGRVSMDQISRACLRLISLVPGQAIEISGVGDHYGDRRGWKRGTINYEVVALISDRVMRVYKD